MRKEILDAQSKILELENKIQTLWNFPVNMDKILNENTCTWEGIGLFILITGVFLIFFTQD
jgi:hypothetical protein